MPLEEAGNINVEKIKLKDNLVYIDLVYEVNKEGKIDKKSDRIKVFYSSFENHPLSIGSVNKDAIEELLKEDEIAKIKDYICSLIIKKPLSKKSILTKTLKKYEDKVEIINNIIKELEEKKIIDDKEFVETYLEYFESAFYGKYYILSFFKKEEISEDIIENIKFSDKDELNKAEKYFRLIKNKYVSSSYVKQKKKISESMLKRGFDLEIINRVISSLKIDEEKELEQLNKIYLKAKEKFINEKNAKNKIVSFLVNRGYQFTEIVNLVNNDDDFKEGDKL